MEEHFKISWNQRKLAAKFGGFFRKSPPVHKNFILTSKIFNFFVKKRDAFPRKERRKTFHRYVTTIKTLEKTWAEIKKEYISVEKVWYILSNGAIINLIASFI